MIASYRDKRARGARKGQGVKAFDGIARRLTALFALGGLLGGICGALLIVKLARHTSALRPLFAAFVVAAGVYVTADGAKILLGEPTTRQGCCRSHTCEKCVMNSMKYELLGIDK